MPALLECLVAIDTPGGPWLGTVRLAPGATVAEAIAAARALPGAPAGADWEGAQAGIWGMRCARSQPVAGGDRVELYRPLPRDPRERRRARAGTTRGSMARRGPRGR